VKKSIFYTIVFFTGIFLQFTVAQYFSIKGIAPNAILLMLIFLALLRGSLAGVIMGFLWGLSWDMYSVDLFGCHAFAYTCIGFAIGKLSRKWDEEKIISQMVLTLLTSVIYWFLIYFCYKIFNPEVYTFKMNYIVVVQPFYNMLIAPAVYWIFVFILGALQFDEEQ